MLEIIAGGGGRMLDKDSGDEVDGVCGRWEMRDFYILQCVNMEGSTAIARGPLDTGGDCIVLALSLTL